MQEGRGITDYYRVFLCTRAAMHTNKKADFGKEIAGDRDVLGFCALRMNDIKQQLRSDEAMQYFRVCISVGFVSSHLGCGRSNDDRVSLIQFAIGDAFPYVFVEGELDGHMEEA